MIRVLLAEDQAMVRGALAALLTLEGDIEIIAEVGRGDEVVSAALNTRPDVALLDIEMPGCDGITAAAALHAQLPSCKVLILTTFGRPGYLRQAMESGVVGFLLKDAPSAQLATAIRRAIAGERVVDPTLAMAALSEGNNPLTKQERTRSGLYWRLPREERALLRLLHPSFSLKALCVTTFRLLSKNWVRTIGLRRHISQSRRVGSKSCFAATERIG